MTMTILSVKQVSLLSMHAVNSPGVSPWPPSPPRGASRVGGPSLRLQSGCAPKHLLQQIPQHEVHQGEAHNCLPACKAIMLCAPTKLLCIDQPHIAVVLEALLSCLHLVRQNS